MRRLPSFGVGLAALALLAALPAAALDPRPIAVIGGGPAGLAAAIELKRQSPEEQIVIVERREQRTRSQSVVLTKGSVAILMSLGVSVLDDPDFVPAFGKKWSADKLAQRLREDPRSSKLEQPAGFLSINVLEERLAAAAGALGIDVVRGEATEVRPRGSGVDVGVRTGAGDARLEAKLAIVADGARSKTAQALGVRYLPTADGIAKLLLVRTGVEGHGEGRASDDGHVLVILGGGREQNALLELPKEFDPSTDAEQLKGFIHDNLRRVNASADAASTQRFDVELLRADRGHIGDRVLLVGDAQRTVNPFSGSGVNLALDDVRELGAIFGRWRDAASPDEREKALVVAEDGARARTDANHAWARANLRFQHPARAGRAAR